MSIYRTFNRAPLSDVHHVVGPASRAAKNEKEQQPGQDWSNRRKGRPADVLLPATIRWIEALPVEVRPSVLGAKFPRIANLLARLWPSEAAFASYMDELLVDRRGARRGFPLEVLTELQRLRTYRSASPGGSDVWGEPTLTR